jgi:quercetin dioxygenase-like cupin family protein
VCGADGKELLVLEVTAPPGYKIPPHTHPGEEFAYTLEGVLTSTSTGEVRGPGQGVFYKRGDIGGAVVGDKPVKLLTIFVVDKGKPRTELVK